LSKQFTFCFSFLLCSFLTIYSFPKDSLIKLDLPKYIVISSSSICSSFFLDNDINNLRIKYQENNYKFSNYGKNLSLFSSNGVTYGISSLFFCYGLYKRDKAIVNKSLLLIEGLTLANGFSFFVKTATGRYRPNSELNDWLGPPNNIKDLKYRFNNDIDSYFSGHSVRMWTIASMLDDLSDNKLLINSIYALAIVSSSGRIIEGEHWLSDVVTGALLGYGLGKLTIYLNKNNKSRFAINKVE